MSLKDDITQKVNKEDLNYIIETKSMKKGKKKWSYRCNDCQQVYNSEEHGQYTLINTFNFDYHANISFESIHEGSLFCTPECALNFLKKNNIDILQVIKMVKQFNTENK